VYFSPIPTSRSIFEATIERTLLDLRQRFNLRKVLFDPWQMQAVAQRLTKAGLRIEEFPQSPANLTAASLNLFELIEAQNLVAYPTPACGLRSAALSQARRRAAGGSQRKAIAQDRRGDCPRDGGTCHSSRPCRKYLQPGRLLQRELRLAGIADVLLFSKRREGHSARALSLLIKQFAAEAAQD
jgi:hypothetical protein